MVSDMLQYTVEICGWKEHTRLWKLFRIYFLRGKWNSEHENDLKLNQNKFKGEISCFKHFDFILFSSSQQSENLFNVIAHFFLVRANFVISEYISMIYIVFTLLRVFGN